MRWAARRNPDAAAGRPEAALADLDALEKEEGLSAEDLIVRVPPGTTAFEAGTGELLCDLVEPGMRWIAAV